MSNKTKCRGNDTRTEAGPKRFLDVLDELSKDYDECRQNLYLVIRYIPKALYPIQQIRAKAERWCHDTEKKVWHWRRVILPLPWGHDMELDVTYQTLGTIESASDPLASFDVICETPPEDVDAVDLRFVKSMWTEGFVCSTLRLPDF